MKIQLGAEYKDKITGFKGTATGFCEYITGCSQVLLVPKYKNGDGDKDTSKWYDEQRLVRVGKKFVKLDNSLTPGFDKTPPGDQGDGEGGADERA